MIDITFDFKSFTLEEDFLPLSRFPDLVGVVIKKYFPKSLYGEASWFKGEVVYLLTTSPIKRSPR